MRTSRNSARLGSVPPRNPTIERPRKKTKNMAGIQLHDTGALPPKPRTPQLTQPTNDSIANRNMVTRSLNGYDIRGQHAHQFDIPDQQANVPKQAAPWLTLLP